MLKQASTSGSSKESSKDLRILGESHVPGEGFLLIPSRLSFSDLLHLEKHFEGREFEYLIDSDGVYDPLLGAHLEKEDVSAYTLVVDDEENEEVFRREVFSNIARGKIIVFVPPPISTHVGTLTHVPSKVLEYLLSINALTVPLFVDKPRELQLAIESPSKSPATIFSFGNPLEREAVNLPNYQEHLLAAGEASFSSLPILDSSLGYALLQGLKRHGSSSKVIDGYDHSELPFGRLLAGAIALSRHLRKETEKERVGIILPPGKGGLLANVAVILAGKVPVNLNFTAGAESIESAMRQAELDRFITADPFVRKTNRFPWPPNKQLILLERLVPQLKKKAILWAILSKLLPSWLLSVLLGIPRKGGDKEAVLLFTSGSSGDPKGVVLTHRNLLANVKQFGGRLSLTSTDSILGCLPLFHSFGCTVTQWYPFIEGLNLVTYPSPLEPPKLADLVEKYSVTLLLATPTFLRGYLRKVEPEKLKSLKFAVVGAEKLPAKVGEAFLKRFGKEVMEGYGLTETSPVSNVNLPDPPPGEDPRDPRVILSSRVGSVGQSLPGIAVRITDPDTDEPLPMSTAGMIWMRGANIFPGYLKLPRKTDEVIRDGWFRTGDVGRMDADGFLYIEGRMSRFSKIGGEMVPHERVEEHINKAFEVDSEAERKFAVVGVPDEAKGEALVLLSTSPMHDQAITEMRYTLLEAGVPSLWIPKKVVHVEEIPLLASGKLDIKGCNNLANAKPIS